MFLLVHLWNVLEQKQGQLWKRRIYFGHCQHAREIEISPGHNWCWEVFYWLTVPECREKVVLDQQLHFQWQCYQPPSIFQLCDHRPHKDIWCCVMWHWVPLDLWKACQMIMALWQEQRTHYGQQKRTLTIGTNSRNSEHQTTAPAFRRLLAERPKHPWVNASAPPPPKHTCLCRCIVQLACTTETNSRFEPPLPQDPISRESHTCDSFWIRTGHLVNDPFIHLSTRRGPCLFGEISFCNLLWGTGD